jgi:hypothetical protein
MACGQEGQQLPAGEGVAVYQDGGGAGADWGGRRGWAEISKDPQRYGVYSLPTYVVPQYATRFMSPLYLCQSRGNPALAPTALPSILGVLAGAERKDTGSSPVPVCCNSPVQY